MERKYKKIVVFEHFVRRTVPLIAPTGKYGKLKCNMVGERCLKVEHTDRQAEIQGTRTKVELQTGLRELLPNLSLEQIRVRELADRCGIRRQSFYYHFSNVYELLDCLPSGSGNCCPSGRRGS